MEDDYSNLFVLTRKENVSCEQKPKKIRKMSKAKKGLLIFFSVVATLVTAILIFVNSLSPVIVSLCEAKIKAFMISAINNAVFEVMSDSLKYTDLVKVEKNADGDITLIEANAILINKLAVETAKKSESNLKKLSNETIDIPIGQLSKTPLFANMGPILQIKVLPYGSVNCTFVSEFEGAGLNQTRHKIYLNVATNVDLILPTSNCEMKNNTQILITESIIVGKVPDSFLNLGNLGGSSLDLVP